MKNKKICDLKISDKYKLVIYEDNLYDKVYNDSYLYLYYGKFRKKLLFHGSFVYDFGRDMYVRLYNIYEYKGEKDISKHIEYYINNVELDSYYAYIYEFATCQKDYELQLYKENDNFHLALIKSKPNKKTNFSTYIYKTKKVLDFIVRKDQIELWKNIITNEYEKRAKELAKNISESEAEEFNEIDFQNFLKSLRDEKKQAEKNNEEWMNLMNNKK